MEGEHVAAGHSVGLCESQGCLNPTIRVSFSPQIPKDPTQRWLRELAALSQQVQQVHPNVLAKILKQRTVYQNEEIVVIDKPYGLPVHGEGEWGMEIALWC